MKLSKITERLEAGTAKALRWFKQNRVSMAGDLNNLNRLRSIFDRAED